MSEDTSKASQVFNAIVRADGWITAEDISCKVDCSWKTAKGHLDDLETHGLVQSRTREQKGRGNNPLEFRFVY